MKKILFLTLLLFLTACDKSEKVFSKLPSDAVILAFGDSLTYGTGADRTQSYPNVLAKLSSHTVINSSVSGEITADGLNRLPKLLDEQHPQLLILIHGANDILRNMPREQTATNLTGMIAEAKQRNIKVVMLGVPTFGVYSLLGFTITLCFIPVTKSPVQYSGPIYIYYSGCRCFRLSQLGWEKTIMLRYLQLSMGLFYSWPLSPTLYRNISSLSPKEQIPD